jgi:arylsulfatase A-like enzyme
MLLQLLVTFAILISFCVGDAKPNFVFFLVDDLGWADVGCNGSTFHETPNIDALAASGVRFTDAYAAASVCSPTRASILTGRHPVRLNITDWIPGNSSTGKFAQVQDRDSLALSEVTVAEVLKENGYQTFFAGKWHLGRKGAWPEDQGFDVNIGGFESGSPKGGYYSPWKNPNLQSKTDGEYLTERLTDETIQFIETQHKKEQPFFAYLSYYNVHTPIQPYKKRIEHFRTKADSLNKAPPLINERGGMSRARQDNPALASMVSAVDDSVGSVLATLEKLGIEDDTVVIFFSDNGGLCTLSRRKNAGSKKQKQRSGPGCNLPLRSGKGWLYEGGIREATIIRTPGTTVAGGVCSSPVISMDFFPTILELAGIAIKPKLHCDGESLVSLLQSPATVRDRTLYWHYPHYHGSGWKPGGAIRDGKWKLIEFWEYGDVQLFDLSQDLGEQNDLSKTHSDEVRQLQTRLAKWRKEMNAVMPVELGSKH